MLSGLLPPVGFSGEPAQVEMAVGDERTHVELAGQSQGLVVVAFGFLESRRITPGGDFTDQAETPRLVTTLLVALGERHGLLCAFQSIVEASLEQVCLAEPRELHRPSHAHRTHRRRVLYHAFEKAPPLVCAPGERARVSETGENRPRLEVPLTGEAARALQSIDGLVEITQSEGHATNARQGLGKCVRVVSAFRDPECLLGMRARLNESAQIREGQGQPAV